MRCRGGLQMFVSNTYALPENSWNIKIETIYIEIICWEILTNWEDFKIIPSGKLL